MAIFDKPTAMRRSVLVFLLVFNLASCGQWSTTDRPLPELLPEAGPRPGSLQIYTARAGWVSVRSPRLRNDSLVWIRHGGYETGIPVSEVRMVQSWKVDGFKTAGLIVLGAVSIYGYIALRAFHDSFK